MEISIGDPLEPGFYSRSMVFVVFGTIAYLPAVFLELPGSTSKKVAVLLDLDVTQISAVSAGVRWFH